MKLNLRTVSNGLLLIFIGVVFLLLNYGVLNWGFWGLFLEFWPLVLIVFGLGLVLNRKVPISLAFLVLGLCMVGVNIFSPATANQPRWFYGYNLGPANEASASLDFPMAQSASKGRVEINALGANINLAATDQGFSQGKFTTYSGTPAVNFSPNGGTAKLTINSDKQFRILNGRGENIDLNLTDKLPLDIEVNTGATKGTLDFSRLKLNNLDLNTGAADLRLEFGATGMNTQADISSGASKITLVAPQEVGLKIHNSGVSNIDFDNRANFSKDGSVYTSSNFNSAVSTVEINISAGASTVDVQQN